MRPRKNISDHIYDIIKNEINTGSLNFGDKISEVDYSNKLNVSRTPLREAIKKLEIEGLIERLPNSRLRVMEMNEKKINEIFDIRIALENILIDSIAENSSILDLLEENNKLTKFYLNAENWNLAKDSFSEYNKIYYEMSDLDFTIRMYRPQEVRPKI